LYFDPSGYIYATGFFSDSIDLDPGSGTDWHYSVGGSYDIFVLKVDLNGNYQWGHTFGGIGLGAGMYDDQGLDLVTDNQGNVALCGTFRSWIDLDPGSDSLIYSAPDQLVENAWIVKYDASGLLLWGGGLIGTGTPIPRGIDVDVNGFFYIHGNFQGEVDFDIDTTSQVSLNSGNSQVGFIARYSPGGVLQWVHYTEGAPVGGIVGWDLRLSPSSDAIYFCGQIVGGSLDFDPGPGSQILSNTLTTSDFYLAKWDTAGNHLFSFSLGGINMENAAVMDIDPQGNIYLSGFFQDTVDFDPGTGVSELYAMTNFVDAFIASYDPSGNLLGAFGFGSNGAITGNERIWGLRVLDSLNIFVTGTLQGQADFDPGSGNYIIIGNDDVFAAKFSMSSTTGIYTHQTARILKLYPNPATAYVRVLGTGDGQLQVIDILGRVVWEGSMHMGIAEIDVDVWQDGVYCLVGECGGFLLKERFVVRHQ